MRILIIITHCSVTRTIINPPLCDANHVIICHNHGVIRSTTYHSWLTGIVNIWLAASATHTKELDSTTITLCADECAEWKDDWVLYLYIPFASAHPQGCIKGTVHSLIRRYYTQNSFREDYINIVSLFYRRICARGWDPTFIRDLIMEASRRIENAPPKPPPLYESKKIADEIYIHLQ